MKLQPRNSYSKVCLKSLLPWNLNQNLQSKQLLTIIVITDLSSNYKYQQEIKQLKDEIKLLKQIKNNHEEEIKTSHTRDNSKNWFQNSVSHRGQEFLHWTDQRHQLHRANHGNFIKLRETLEDTIRFQSDPAG